MTNTDLLEAKIRAKNLTITSVANKLGLTRAGLYKKLNGVSEFKASEISKLSAMLSLSYTEREQIFFASFVDTLPTDNSKLSDIPRFLLSHTVTLREKVSSNGWGGRSGTVETVISFVRVEPCRSQRFSLSEDIPEVKAKLFYDAFSSSPREVSFEPGDEIIFGSESFTISEVEAFYAGSDNIHHLEVLLK